MVSHCPLAILIPDDRHAAACSKVLEQGVCLALDIVAEQKV